MCKWISLKQDWYHNTTDNDLPYWGSDYPPLTAHHSWVAAARVNSSWVTNTLEHRLMIRLSVMAADHLILLPAFFMFSAWTWTWSSWFTKSMIQRSTRSWPRKFSYSPSSATRLAIVSNIYKTHIVCSQLLDLKCLSFQDLKLTFAIPQLSVTFTWIEMSLTFT